MTRLPVIRCRCLGDCRCGVRDRGWDFRISLPALMGGSNPGGDASEEPAGVDRFGERPGSAPAGTPVEVEL